MNPPTARLVNCFSKFVANRAPHLGAPASLPLLLAVGVLNLFSTARLHANQPMPPAAPSGLSASAVSVGQINLRWQDNSSNESGFIIQRAATSSGPWAQAATTGANVASYSNTGLSAATTYYYRVCAYNSRGNSSFSSTTNATTFPAVASCTYSISPASASVSAAASSGTLTVTTGAGCGWTPSSTQPTWLTCTPANGAGNATVTWSVTANSTTSPRTATLTVAGQTFSVSQAATTATGPANDICASANAISGSSAALPCSNVGATKEVGEPNHAGNAGGKSVWWSWTAPSAGSVTINTFGSSFDTLLGVYTGTSVSSLTTIASNDDSGSLQSAVNFNAVAGTTYQIAVDGYNGASGNITLNLSQTVASCTYSISPTSASPASGAVSGSVTVTAGAGCSWTASSSATGWLTCTPASGTGNGTVSYSVTANTSTTGRSATLSIAGQTFTVNQAGAACTYAISAANASATSAGGNGSVTVSAGTGCSWTPSSNASWLTCTPANGTANGTITWTVTANTNTSPRTGSLTIAGQAFTVTQDAAPCTYSISPTSAGPASGAVSGSVTVTAGTGCSWTASSSATSWLTCTPASGSGTGTVSYSVTVNTSTTARSATLTIAGQTFTVNQAGAACSYAISPANASAASAVGSGSVSVTAGTGCSWTPSSNAGWLTCTPPNGTANGTITWTVTANTNTSPRTGTLTISGQTFTVTQDAAPCTHSISPTSAGPAAGAVSGSVTVTAGTGCSWTASSSATSWLTCTPASGTGGGSVSYSVTANTSTTARSATLSIAGQTFTVNQAGAACTYSISPASASIASAGSSGSVAVTAGSGCSWTATGAPSWITITAGATGSGNGTVNYSVAANTNTTQRSANLTIAGQAFTVSEDPAPCTYAISPSTGSFTSTGGNGSVTVTAGAGCVWTALSSASWITTTNTGTGSATASYTVAANTTTSSRTGTLTIAGQTVTVTQSGAACTYAISPTSGTFTSAAGTGSVTVTTVAGCTWAASSGATWITTTSSGTGSGTAAYTVAANATTSARTGSLTIAGQTYTVNQDAAPCSYALSPSSANPGSAATSGTISVTAAAGCAWTPSSSAVWLTFAPANGTGSGAITWSVTANTSTGPRTGTLTIAGQTLTVTQAGAACTYAISPASASPDSAAGSGTLTVTAGAGCNWTPSSSAAWLSCTPANGAGNGAVTWSVTANTGTSSRTGTLSIAGQTFTVTQAGAAPTAGPWVQRMGGTGYDCGRIVATDGSGNIIVAGYFFGTADFGGGPLSSTGSNCDLFLAKYTSSGAHLWSKRLGGTGSEMPRSIAVDSSGNILLAGSFNGATDLGGGSLTSAGADDIFIAKYSSSAAYLWAQRFGSSWDSDVACSIQADTSGNVLVTGFFSGSVDFGGGPLSNPTGGTFDTFVAKYSPTGAHLWSKAFGAALGAANQGNGIVIDGNGDVVVVGEFLTSIDAGGGQLTTHGARDVYLAKFSSAGAHLWSKNFGGAYGDYAAGIAVDSARNLLVVGKFNMTSDWGAGTLTTAGTDYDVVLGKYSSSGACLWTKAFPGAGDQGACGVAVDANDNAVVSGYFQVNMNLGGSLLISDATITQLYNDVFVGKFSPAGTGFWSERFGGPSDDQGLGITVDGTGHVIVTGVFQGTANFGGQTLTSVGSSDAFLLRLDP